MGRVPGLPLGYEVGAVAKVAGKTVNDNRKKPNHVFYGPNYSIAHPGVFPFNLKASRWSMQDWLAFDWRAGWGTEAFENQVADGKLAAEFPPVWKEADDRRDAREIIEINLKKLEHKREIRQEIMENGSRVDGPVFDTQPCRGQELKFHVVMTNTNEGHNLLTASLGAQPQLWANIVLIGPDGRRLWETGYTDSFGDLANIHSEDVRHKNLAFDWQLFNLQTMFLITGATGTDREFFLPVNLDIDQLPFIRPGTQPITTLNHPPFIRMESQSLAATGSRKIPYRIPGELLQQAGTYRLSFRLRSRAEPMYLMRFCDATLEMQRSMNEWMIDLHPILDLSLTDTLTLTADWNFFWRESLGDGIYTLGGQLLRPAGQGLARYVGSTPSLTTVWAASRHLTFLTSYVHVFPGEFMQQSPPSKPIDYFTAWLTYKF